MVISEHEVYGDTYAKYCQRCQLASIEPESFYAWLYFELSAAPRSLSAPTY